MNFSDSEKIASVIKQLKEADRLRAQDRTLVQNLFNGFPPWTKEEEAQNKIRVNVNWGEGSDLMLMAREQYENAHLSTDPTFQIRVPNASRSKQMGYGGTLTTLVNKILRQSRPYLHTRREKWASVTMHGIGPSMHEDAWKWCPYFVGISDLLIPTDTDLTMEGLNHFDVKRRMTPGQLFRKTLGLPEAKRDPGWKMDTVRKVLDQYKDVNQQQDHWDFSNDPEKAAEVFKQNTNYYDADGVPKIHLHDFYHQEDESGKPCWYRKILLDSDCVGARTTADPITLLYDAGADKPFADSIDQILHLQFADGNNVPPFMYHSTRSLGLRLFDSVQMLNRLRCQFMQHIFEQLMNLFRVTDPSDRARLEQIYLGLNYGIFPDGLNFVTKDQRYSADANLLEMQLSQLKQLIGEASQQYTQDIDTGTNKERTAFEVSALLNQTTKLTASMLNLSYLQETFQYREICRRLTLPGSPDWDARTFRNDAIVSGIPERFINSEEWEIEPVRVLGSGNAQLEVAQAQALMQNMPAWSPEGQQTVKNLYAFSVTHNPKLANILAPLDAAPHVSDTVHDTELVFGALMQGAKVTPKPGLNPVEVVPVMIGQMTQKVQEIALSGGVGTPAEVKGLERAQQYADAFVQQLAQDKANAAMVKQFGDQLGKIGNLVKAFAQRQAEAAKKAQAQGGNGEAQLEMAQTVAKLQSQQAMTQQKLQSNAQKHAQKLAQNQQKFAQQQQIKRAQTAADLATKGLQAGVEAGTREPPTPASEE